jgi:hypothetical protein
MTRPAQATVSAGRRASISHRATTAAFPNVSSAQAFTSYITSDETGKKMLFKAATMAARSAAQATQDLPAPKSFGPATRELNEVALARAKIISVQEAYGRVCQDPAHAALVRRAREESMRVADAATRQRWPLWQAERASQTRQWI